MTLVTNHVVSDNGHTADHNAIATQVNANTSAIVALTTASEYTPLSRLTRKPAQLLPVVEANVAGGGTLTLGTFTGAGTLRQVQLTLNTGPVIQNVRLQIFVDGETLPSIDADMSTLFLTGSDAIATSQSASTDHLVTSIKGSAAGGPAWSGGFFFPVPYNNGCIVKIYNPEAGNSVVYAQIVNHPGETSNYRLRSACVPAKTPLSATALQQITFFDVPNAKGSLVYFGLVAIGTGGIQYLERREWFAVDGESTTPDVNGVVTPSFSSSGGEDLFLNGWYFSALPRITNQWVIATCVGSSNATVAGIDFLGLYGGIPFNTEIAGGWGLKSAASNGSLVPLTYAFTALYYVDITTPFVPSRPRSLAGTAGNTTANLSWTQPASFGSSAITGYTITCSNGTTVALPASATSVVYTGLTNGTAYTFTITATNAVGTSSASAPSNSVTPTTASVPSQVTGLAASGGNAQNILTWTAPSNGGNAITNYKVYRATVSGSETLLTTVGNVLTYTDAAVTNGTTYYYKVSAVNGVGEGAQSAEQSATPANFILDDNFSTYANGNLAGNVTPQGQTWTFLQGAADNVVSSHTVKANLTGGGSDRVSTIATGTSDSTVTVTFTAGPQVSVAAVARASASTKIHFVQGNGHLTLYVAGVQRQDTGHAVTSGTSHTLTLDVRGSAVTCKFDGSTVFTYTLTSGEITALAGLQAAGINYYTQASPGAGQDDGNTAITRVQIVG